ncbi:Calx-beta domain-containing protein, partial [Maribacter sp. 2308TA10-17]|uniref:Calx-beta domain-containing protein n=1 Tax=Maribacter sp. 2308TA10-17 TaxID=3386276 RepID=UPI0039BD733F
MRKTIHTLKYLKHFLLFGVMLLSFNAIGQVQQTFAPRYSEKVNGDVTMIANNVLSEHPTNNYNGGSDNNSIFSVFVDIDSDDTTFNSSSANLVNPSPSSPCLTFTRAYLYWAAANKENGPDNNGNMTGNGLPEVNWAYDQVKLMLPGSGSYTTVTADEVIYNGRAAHFVNDPYVCVKDITTEVQALANPYGKFQVANVKATVGNLWEHLDVGDRNTGTSGGWQIVFVYESPQLKSRNITLFDGYANVTQTNNSFDILFDGFQTVPNGPVNANILIGSTEGDRGIDGDQLQIFDTNGVWTSLDTNERADDNFFNSKITIDENPFLNRNPASTNTLGFDASLFELSNNGRRLIDNNQTSATFRLTSDQETYGLYLLGLSVEVFEPSLGALSFTTNVIGSQFDPGDNAPVEIRVKNVGNDNIQNLEIALTLPPQVEFLNTEPLPPGVTYNFDTITRELRFFVEDGYTDINDPEYELDFNLFINNTCVTCSADIGLQAFATFTGETNPNTVGTLSSGTVDACGIGNHDPTYLHVTPVLSISDGSATEGENINFAISSSHLLAEDAVLNLSYTDITTSVNDYALANTFTVVTGTGNTSFNIPALDDTFIENTETFEILATSTDNITLLDNTATGSILDNDLMPNSGISFDDDDITVNEAAGTATVNVVLTGNIQGGFTLDFASGDNTAVAPGDYLSNSNTLSFNGTDGESIPVTISINDDSVIEATESLFVNLSNLSTTLISINDNQATINITDNDNAAPGDGVSFDNATVVINEGNPGDNVQLAFAVNYTGTIPPGETVSVDYNTIVGSADAIDFTLANGTVSFTDGAQSQTILVDVIEDLSIEADENFTLELSNISTVNGFVTGFVDANTTNTATGTIINDDNAAPGDGVS